MVLDIGTVLFTTGLVGLVLVLFSWTLALAPQAPRWRKAWAWGNTTLVIGVTLYLGQGTVSPWLSVILANGLVVLGYHLLELSLREFAARKPRGWAMITIAATFVVTFVPFTIVWDVYAVRVVVYSVLVVAVWIRILGLLYSLPEYRNHRTMVRSFMLLAVLILFTQAGRAVVALGENGRSLLAPSQALALMLIVSMLVIVAWSLGFITLELLRSRRHLEESLETRDRMIQLIAHDLRGPIGGQVGLLEVMRSEGQCREDEGEMLDLLAVSAQKSSDLLENLLDWAQNQRGTLALNPEPLDGRDLLDQAAEPYATTAHTKRIALSIDAETHRLVGDRRTLTTVLRNLISNAVKFTPEGGRIRLTLTSSPLEFVIQDSGTGLTAEQLERLNVGGALPSTMGTGQEPGSGLGLSLCRDLTRLNGGTLHFESSSQGTIARLTLRQEKPT